MAQDHAAARGCWLALWRHHPVATGAAVHRYGQPFEGAGPAAGWAAAVEAGMGACCCGTARPEAAIAGCSMLSGQRSALSSIPPLSCTPYALQASGLHRPPSACSASSASATVRYGAGCR